MPKNLKQKPVIFNLADPFQLKLLAHCNKQKNYSGYIKELIRRDMEGTYVALNVHDTTIPDNVDVTGFL